MKKFRSGKIILAVSVIVVGAVSLAFQQPDIYFLIKKNFTIFSETYEDVTLEYVDEVNPEMLMRTGMEAMLETLDPYTVFYNESQNEQAEIISRSNYAGIGIEAGVRDGEIVVVAPTEGGPADRKGIRAGDVIVEVDGIATETLQPEEVQNLTMGEIGSTITLTIRRYGIDQPFEVELEREKIDIKNVTHSTTLGVDNKIGYIRLAQFGLNSAAEVREAMTTLGQKEEGLDGLILDLRDNPGGILQEAVSIIDKFVEPGITVVETRGRIAEYNDAYETREPVMFDKPVIVLMNGGSASASEVVAGALQDLDRAVIMGERSFGKGLVQIVKPLPYNTSLKITISRYYTPSGRSIQSLAYTHQSRNASVSREEFANQVYKTRNGRPVKEGRGIEPDVESAAEDLSMLEISLLREGAYVDFASEYETNHASFEATELPDEVYDDFIRFLNESEFEYESDSEVLLMELSASLKEEDINVDDEISSIQKLLAEQEEKEFKSKKDQISKTLYLELLSRFKGQSERSSESLNRDTQVQKALQLLSSPEEVQNILNGAG
ncbi:MAG TPA: hypothetical protein DEQ34_03745 [Balneolaceae bacterium]|nr:hypothetical protein [Balneolaceae bacterium]|tara:strand:- start:287328 stop:288980 length:1653 start_codon:yes stop_codon:yes gene_type:complete